MPEHVVDRVADLLNGQRLAVNGARVLIMGVAYKRDIGDMRESPALDVMSHLAERGAELSFHDPYVAECEVGEHRFKGVDLTDEVIQEADIIVILTDHSEVDYAGLVAKGRCIFDTRNATQRLEGHYANVVKL